MTRPRLTVPDPAERDALAVFVARAVRLDPAGLARLRRAAERVEVWGSTPFEVLVVRDAAGSVEPADATVTGSDLLAALSIVGGPSVEVGTPVDERWRGALPGPVGWTALGEVPDVDGLVERVVAGGTDADPDAVVLTIGEARVPARCVLALAGTGLTDDGGPVRVSVGGPWLRLDTPGGAVVHRRWRLEVKALQARVQSPGS